ncbi:AT-rich interactive domain-containing protein 3A [Puma concolor]|uniref:AT-rich interactive domain-containing protein 3 n=1 Tax=Puma concolor TaxID=9696 RepID=A0A6P6H8Q2_PUMCO|nr:AT-rich interactive domain-containing protein 3A [Puma concolor]
MGVGRGVWGWEQHAWQKEQPEQRPCGRNWLGDPPGPPRKPVQRVQEGKPKWEEEEEEEEELEEELDEEEDEEEEDEEEDEDEEAEDEDEEGLGPPGSSGLGPAALIPRRAPPSQAFRGDGGPRVLGSQERPGAGLAHAGGAAHVAPQLQPPDHGDWTYEEQFKQRLFEREGRKEALDKASCGQPLRRPQVDPAAPQLGLGHQAFTGRAVFGIHYTPDPGGTGEGPGLALHQQPRNTSVKTTKAVKPTRGTSILLSRGPAALLAVHLCSLEAGSAAGDPGGGTPVNRIPIMAKQVLDLFMLYVLVTEKGGLVEVINKKLWREITKGLNLPTSITSAAFTLRTQYMKYLYPYECEKRGLSNPNELQAAIDSNRREGRRQSFGGSLFAYSPGGAHGMLSSPKLPVPSLGLAASTNGSSITPAPKIKKACESRQDSAANLTSPNGSNSISMSVEINGIMYTGVLFAQPPSAPSKGGGGGSRGGTSGTSSSSSSSSSTGSQAGPAGLSTPATSSTSNNSLP